MPAYTTTPDKHGRSCSSCNHWLIDEKKKIVIENSLMVPIADWIAAGHSLEGVTTAVTAPCTADPDWKFKPDCHWCGRYVDRTAG